MGFVHRIVDELGACVGIFDGGVVAGHPEAAGGDEAVVHGAVGGRVAVREVGEDAAHAEKGEGDAGHDALRGAAFAVVGGQRCNELKGQECPRGKKV